MKSVVLCADRRSERAEAVGVSAYRTAEAQWDLVRFYAGSSRNRSAGISVMSSKSLAPSHRTSVTDSAVRTWPANARSHPVVHVEFRRAHLLGRDRRDDSTDGSRHVLGLALKCRLIGVYDSRVRPDPIPLDDSESLIAGQDDSVRFARESSNTPSSVPSRNSSFARSTSYPIERRTVIHGPGTCSSVRNRTTVMGSRRGRPAV